LIYLKLYIFYYLDFEKKFNEEILKEINLIIKEFNYYCSDNIDDLIYLYMKDEFLKKSEI
jgi:hypothetical protein